MKRFSSIAAALILICLTLTALAQEVKLNTNLVVEADGKLRTDGVATVWDDIMVFPAATTRGSSKAPILSAFKNNGSSQGVFLWMFSVSEEQELYFTVQIPAEVSQTPTCLQPTR